MSLIKQHIYGKMIFQVLDIEFDFVDSEGELPYDEQAAIVQDIIGEPWQADDEDDLIEEITCSTGFCINSINYRNILK
jgi:hypothetical protein